MKSLGLLVPAILLLIACSETPVEERGDEAIAEMEKQIEAEARSLEQAADEAVKAMSEDIDAELAAEGVGAPTAESPPKETTD
ncbi:hypothetical protein [Parasphingorhabdus sp.]|uniref:hypothetical protein n=1 Tax=Parasphingorhabdus sp. TaxID=2709688 RepID=UPI003A8CD41F